MNTNIYVRDRFTDTIHRVGTQDGDELFVDKNGVVQYRNSQNGCETKVGDINEGQAVYEFVDRSKEKTDPPKLARIINFRKR